MPIPDLYGTARWQRTRRQRITAAGVSPITWCR